MLDQIQINSVDVTTKRISWNYQEEWNYAIASLEIVFSPTLVDTLVPVVGNAITVKRGYVSATEQFIFNGQITQVKPEADKITCICKGRLYDAIKNARTKSWDMNIDTEQGVGSEIFKSICDHNSFNYDNTTIISTGTGTTDKIVKFVQNDEDDFDKMNELAERYNYTVMYNPTDDKVYFQPKGYVTYPKTLIVGIDIPGQIKWKYNMEQLINKVKVQGATVYDKVVETFPAPATVFTLSKTPEDTEVRQDSNTGTLYIRGQKDVGILGVDFDYYVDTELKTITFASNMVNIWIRYGAQVPMPVVLTDNNSINLYGGPNKIPHFKKFVYADIKDVSDAINRGKNILARYSTPFIEAIDIPIYDVTLQTYGQINPGNLITIQDDFNDINVNVFVKFITKSFPHVTDLVTIGDEIWRTEDWQTTQMKKINQLINDLNKNQDVLIIVEDNTNDLFYEPQYLYIQKRTGGGSYVITQLYMANQVYKEYFTNTGRINLTATTATVDTTNLKVIF